MLTKRTNILFSKELWHMLIKLASVKNISVGQLVREAVEEKYGTADDKLLKRQRAIASTLEKRLVSKEKIDYKELINYGRKY